MPIKWDKSHSVNVKIIDNQHRHFIGMLNTLYDYIYEGKSREELGIYLNNLIKYADLHFATEEKYFDKFKYENSDTHKNEHAKLRSQIMEFKNKFAAGAEDITVALVDFLENWLVDHLEVQDKKYTKCFNDHGLF